MNALHHHPYQDHTTATASSLHQLASAMPSTASDAAVYNTGGGEMDDILAMAEQVVESATVDDVMDANQQHQQQLQDSSSSLMSS